MLSWGFCVGYYGILWDIGVYVATSNAEDLQHNDDYGAIVGMHTCNAADDHGRDITIGRSSSRQSCGWAEQATVASSLRATRDCLTACPGCGIRRTSFLGVNNLPCAYAYASLFIIIVFQ